MDSSGFFDILILLGAVQGFISFVLLYRSKKNKLSNRLLSLIIFFISLACLNMYLFLTLDISEASFLSKINMMIPLIIVMPLGPLLFFYTRSVLENNFEIGKKERLHFSPVLLDIVPNLLAAGYFVGEFFGFTESSQLSSLSVFTEYYDQYVDIPRWISLTVYLVLSFKMMKTSSATQKTSQWVSRLLIGFLIFQLLWFVHLVPYIMPGLSQKLLNFVGWYPVYIPLTVLVYWLGINGLILHQHNLNTSTTMTTSEVDEAVRLLNEAIHKNQLYLNPELKLSHVVEDTGIPARKISYVLNQHHGKSFNEFVNTFRVQEVTNRMKNPDYQHLTITGIALDCGFNSQATFQRTFKAITGQTPRAFKNEVHRDT